jgi:hypothetical protein
MRSLWTATCHFAGAVAVALFIGVQGAVAQSPFDAMKRAAEAEALRRAEQALRNAATPPAPASPAPPPSQTTPSQPTPSQTSSSQSGSSAAMSAPPNAAYKVQEDGGVILEVAPYTKTARYGNFPTPPLMRMPAPIVLAAPGQLQPPVWSKGRASSADGRTAADEKEFSPDGECRWYLQQSTAGMASPQDAARQGVSSAEMNALRANINPIYEWMSKQAGVDKPVGVCALFSNSGVYATPSNPSMISAGFALRGSVMVGFWPGGQLKRRGERIVAEGEISHVMLGVNQLPSGQLSRLAIADAAGEMFAEIPVTHLLQGFPLYRNGGLFIAVNDRPLTRAVRTDRLLRWQMAEIDKDLPARKSEAARKAEQLARMESPEQRAQNEAIIAERAKRSYGGDMAKARASFESERKDELDRLRAQADPNAPGSPLGILTRMRAEAETKLKTMSPQDAAAQGCLSSVVADTVVPDVLPISDPNCVHRMEEANPDYFDRSAPRTKIQIIDLSSFPLRRVDSRDDDAAYNLLVGVNWQALRRDVLGGK